MKVRSFQLSDCSSVSKLLKEVLSEGCYEETMEAFARQLSLDSDLVLLAIQNNEIAGVIIGTIDNDEGYYYRIAVDRNKQRKGIGKFLIQSLKTQFEKRKVNKIMITVDMHNEAILPMYKSLGYRDDDFLHSLQHLRIVNG